MGSLECPQHLGCQDLERDSAVSASKAHINLRMTPGSLRYSLRCWVSGVGFQLVLKSPCQSILQHTEKCTHEVFTRCTWIASTVVQNGGAASALLGSLPFLSL